MKKIAFVVENEDDKTFINSLKLLRNEGVQCDIYHINPTGEQSLPLIEDTEKAQLENDVFDRLLNLGSNRLESSLTLREHYAFDSTSWIFYSRFKLYFSTLEKVQLKRRIEKLLERYEEVHCYTNSCPQVSESVTWVRTRAKRKAFQFAGLLHYLLTAIVRWVLSVFRRHKSANWLIIESPLHYRNIIDQNVKQVFENSFFMGFYRVMKDGPLVLDHLPIQKSPFFRFDWKLNQAFKGKKSIAGEQVLMSYFIRPTNWAEIVKVWKKHRQLSQFQITPKGDIERVMLDILKGERSSMTFFNVKYLAFRRYFRLHNFKAVLAIDENSANNRAILDAARAEGVSTIAYQHGSVHRLNPMYRYHKDDFRLGAVPDLTLLWDSNWEDFLLGEGGYPIGTTQVVGNLKTDIIPSLIKSEAAFNLKQKYEGKKVILFASQPLRDSEFQKKIVRDLLVAIASRNDLYLVYRPHPRELDNGWVDAMMDEMKLVNAIIDPYTDLYLALASADVLVTYFSTVAMEAQYFQLPVVLYDPLDQDILAMKKNGLGLQSKNINELRDNLNLALTGKQKNTEKKIDGEVARRFIEIIESHL